MEVTTRSLLHAPPEQVWEHIASFDGINDEFAPLMKMTAPRAVRERGLDGVVVGERLCRSWVLLFRAVPFDYDDITLVRLDPGRGFHERSTMLSQREWEHERTLDPDGDGTRITDRVAFVPRFGLPPRAVRPVVARIFRHRHRRLRRRFGGRALDQTP